jgi:hypothetical protein
MRLLVTPTTAHIPPDTTRAFITRTFAGSGSGGVYGCGDGVGDLGQMTATTAAGVAAAGAQTTATLLVAFGAIAGPIGLAIGAIAAIAPMIVKLFSGCGATCTQVTQYANQVEQILKQNLQSYLSAPIRTVSMQQAAVNNYNTAIASLEQACGQAQLGSAGQNCIDERVDASSCQWKAQAGGWSQSSDGTCTYTPWGANNSGTSCWNWVIGYLNPITQDPCVQPDSSILSAGTTTDTSTLSSTLGDSAVLSSLQNNVQVGTLSLPVWSLIAAGIAALVVME